MKHRQQSHNLVAKKKWKIKGSKPGISFENCRVLTLSTEKLGPTGHLYLCV